MGDIYMSDYISVSVLQEFLKIEGKVNKSEGKQYVHASSYVKKQITMVVKAEDL